MPEQLAAILRGVGSVGSVGSAGGPIRPSATVASTSGHEALKQAALREALARAGASNVGYPTRVVLEAHSARVDFAHNGARVCPVSHNEHKSNHYCVVLRVDERTGLPALFVYCHSAKEGCKGSGHRMLGFLESTAGGHVTLQKHGRGSLPPVLIRNDTPLTLGPPANTKITGTNGPPPDHVNLLAAND
jgi:hypothetical protein